MEAIIAIRQHFHKYPEGRFEEVNTQKKLQETLQGFGIKDIKKCAKTGLVVDIHGKGPSKVNGGIQCIAIRADIDGLFMPENNHDCPYRTTTQYAHMCGHDGHMAMLLAAA